MYNDRTADKNQTTIFLSYCTADSDVTDIVETSLLAYFGGRIKISRFVRDVYYRGSFVEFMKTIGEHDFVVTVVSDNYLKSLACMFEVGEIIKDKNYKDKLIFIVLSDYDKKYYKDIPAKEIAANIYKPIGRASYIEHWEQECIVFEDRLERIKSLVAKSELIEDLRRIRKIIDNDISVFMDYLADARGFSLSEMLSNNFTPIYEIIERVTISNIFASLSSLNGIIRNAIERVFNITQTDYNQILFFVREEYTTSLMVIADRIVNTKQKYRVASFQGLLGKAISTSQVLYEPDVTKNPKYLCAVPETRSELIIPIKVNDNIVGLINSESDEINHFTPEMIEMLKILSIHFGKALNEISFEPYTEKDSVPYISITHIPKIENGLLNSITESDAQPRTYDDIKRLTSTIRKLYNNNFYFDILKYLEFTHSLVNPNFSLLIYEGLGHTRTVSSSDATMLAVGRDIYEDAVEGKESARFALAHELGHYMLHINNFNKYKENGHEPPYISEIAANLFAGELLAPTDLIRNMRNGSVEELSKIFGVSESVIRDQLEKVNNEPKHSPK